MVDQPPERNQVEYVYQNQTIIGHRVQTATAPTANSHAEKETYKTNPNIEPQASSPRSSPLPAGCLAVHWRCLGKKVRTRVGAEIPTRLADPLHRYIPTRLADPMPIFNPQGTNFPGVMGTEARVSNGFKGSQCFGHQQGFPPVESDFCRYCLQSSQYQTLSYSKAHTHTKKRTPHIKSSFSKCFHAIFPLICWQEAWPNRPWKVLPHAGSLCLWRGVWSSSSRSSSDSGGDNDDESVDEMGYPIFTPTYMLMFLACWCFTIGTLVNI